MCEFDYIAYRKIHFLVSAVRILSGAVHCRETPPTRDTLFWLAGVFDWFWLHDYKI